MKFIPLNIIYDYPVKWTKYQVLRDLLQNFYDSLSYKEFSNKFSYSYDEYDRLILHSQGVSFNYEWLIHMGSSTKRNSNEHFAGYFGEGFKVASLCSKRDYNWEICIYSDKWLLRVVTSEIIIDGKKVLSLAYEVNEDMPYIDYTELVVSNFKKSDLEIFTSAMYSFYYYCNPLLGDIIWEDDYCAVLYRSNVPKTLEYPSAGNKGEGIVFASFQAIASFDAPLIFCLHNFKKSDRDRKYYSQIDVINILVEVSRRMPSEAALIVLKKMSKYWYSYPSGKYGYKSYYSVIKYLIWSLECSRQDIESFKKEFPNLLVAYKIRVNDLDGQNKRMQAKSWLKSWQIETNQKYRLVLNYFEDIGYSTLEYMCRCNGGFAEIEDAFALDKDYIQILEAYVNEFCLDFFEFTEMPICKIIYNSSASLTGKASCNKLDSFKKNKYGFKIKYRLNYVAVKKILLNNNCFEEALSTYLHELCHIFGGDKSENFSYALTDIIAIVLKNYNGLCIYKEKWNKVGEQIY